MKKKPSQLFDEKSRHFNLLICRDTDMKIPLDVDISDCKYIVDLKKQIGQIIQMKLNTFYISNYDENTETIKIKDKDNILIKFYKTVSDVSFLLPDEEKSRIIKECDKLSYDQIIEKFQKFNFYISLKSKNDLSLTIFGIRIKTNKMKLDYVPAGTNIKVVLNEKSIRIDYNGKKFIFKAGELISKSEEFIQKMLKIPAVSINSENDEIKDKKELIQNEKYNISTMCSYKFIDQDEKAHDHKLEMDATVLDAKNILAIIYNTTSNNIIIYDKKTKATNLKKLLRELEEIHFDINVESKAKTNAIISPVKTNQNMKKSISKIPAINPNQKPSGSRPKTPVANPKTEASKPSGTRPKTPVANPSPVAIRPKTPKANSKLAASKPAATVANPKLIDSKQTAKVTTKTPAKPSSPSKPIKTQKVSIKPADKKDEKPEEEPQPKHKAKLPHVTISKEPVKEEDDDSNDSTSYIEIYFVFEESTGKTIKPPKQKIDPDTTINELSSIISKQYGIPEIIEIKYKEDDEKVTVDKEMTIDDIREEMIQKEKGRSKNVLYIGHKEQKTSSEKPNKEKHKIVYKPKKSPAKSDSDTDSESDDRDFSAQDHYLFEFDEDERDFLLTKESFLSDHIDFIKQKYQINESDEIGFKIANEDDDNEENDGEIITDMNQPMKNFDDKKIIVYLTSEDAASIYLTVKRMADKKAVIKTYSFMTNVDDQRRNVELDTKATVKSLKRAIHRIKKFKNSRLSDMKVLFAGKDLLDDLVLDKLNVGNVLLYVYIRSTDDILLMTAKALRFDDDDDESDNDDSD